MTAAMLALALLASPPLTLDISSKITGHDYRIHLTVPAEGADYPVVYAADAHMTREPLEAALKELKMPAALAIIGVQSSEAPAFNAQRWQDLTPGRDLEAEEHWSHRLGGPLESGGADRFARALREEIFPAVEKECQASGTRHYIGYSFGGLFGAFALRHEPGLFQGYGLGSPSLWWNDEKLLEGFAVPEGTTADVLITWGSDEPPEISEKAPVLADKIKGAPGVTLATHEFEGKDHSSAMAPSLEYALRHLLRERESDRAK